MFQLARYQHEHKIEKISQQDKEKLDHKLPEFGITKVSKLRAKFT